MSPRRHPPRRRTPTGRELCGDSPPANRTCRHRRGAKPRSRRSNCGHDATAVDIRRCRRARFGGDGAAGWLASVGQVTGSVGGDGVQDGGGCRHAVDLGSEPTGGLCRKDGSCSSRPSASATASGRPHMPRRPRLPALAAGRQAPRPGRIHALGLTSMVDRYRAVVLLSSLAEAIVGRRRGAGGVGADRMIGSRFPVRRGPCGSIICAMSNGATR